jgi:Fe2+ or Zn2+ uptake regulation protein
MATRSTSTPADLGFAQLLRAHGLRATVYNALGELAEAGLLGVVEGPGPRRFDANVMPHHHFRCRQCHELHDVDLDNVDVTLRERGFKVQSSHVLLEGLCPRCADGPAPTPAP